MGRMFGRIKSKRRRKKGENREICHYADYHQGYGPGNSETQRSFNKG